MGALRQVYLISLSEKPLDKALEFLPSHHIYRPCSKAESRERPDTLSNAKRSPFDRRNFCAADTSEKFWQRRRRGDGAEETRPRHGQRAYWRKGRIADRRRPVGSRSASGPKGPRTSRLGSSEDLSHSALPMIVWRRQQALSRICRRTAYYPPISVLNYLHDRAAQADDRRGVLRLEPALALALAARGRRAASDGAGEPHPWRYSKRARPTDR